MVMTVKRKLFKKSVVAFSMDVQNGMLMVVVRLKREVVFIIWVKLNY